MSSVKITYKEPEDRPIEKVEWGTGYRYTAEWCYNDLWITCGSSAVVHVGEEAVLEWARAILKMVEQRHG